MSNAEHAVEPKKKKNPLIIAATLICGLAAIVAGVIQMSKGINEIVGSGDSAQLKQLLTESDQAIDEANKFNLAAVPLFNELLKDVDSLGLKAFHEQKEETARQISEQFGKAAAEFRVAIKKLNEAVPLHTKDAFKTYAASKSRSYESAAEICEQYQEIIRLVLDKSFEKLDDLLPKIQESVARREAAQKASNEAAAEADKLGKELTGAAK